MRHEPTLVDRIARKTAREMIVDATVRHFVECQLDHLQHTVARPTPPNAQQKLHVHRVREFRRMAETAVRKIERAFELRRGVVQKLDAQLSPPVAPAGCSDE